jgi:hypothetical protein
MGTHRIAVAPVRHGCRSAIRLLFCSLSFVFTGWLSGHTSSVKQSWVTQVSSVEILFDANRASRAPARALSEADAIDLWIARWLRIRRKDLVARYGCDPRRIYEVWEGRKHPAARQKALELFRSQYPWLMDRVDFGPHRRIPRDFDCPNQLSLFDEH